MKKDRPTGDKVTKKMAITPGLESSSKQPSVKYTPPDPDVIKKLRKRLSNALKDRNQWMKWCRENDQKLFDLEQKMEKVNESWKKHSNWMYYKAAEAMEDNYELRRKNYDQWKQLFSIKTEYDFEGLEDVLIAEAEIVIDLRKDLAEARKQLQGKYDFKNINYN